MAGSSAISANLGTILVAGVVTLLAVKDGDDGATVVVVVAVLVVAPIGGRSSAGASATARITNNMYKIVYGNVSILVAIMINSSLGGLSVVVI